LQKNNDLCPVIDINKVENLNYAGFRSETLLEQRLRDELEGASPHLSKFHAERMRRVISNQVILDLDQGQWQKENFEAAVDHGSSQIGLSELSKHWFPKFMFGIRTVLKAFYKMKYLHMDRLDDLDPKQGAIIVSNHEAGIDPFFIGSVLEKQIFTLTKWKEAQKSSSFLKVAKFFGSVPVAQGNNSLARQVTEQLLIRGKFVSIFPEGAIHPLKKRYEGRKGFAWFAQSTGVPVIPVGITGNGTLLPGGKNHANGLMPKYKSCVTLNFGYPMYFDWFTNGKNVISRFRDEVMYQIRTLSDWYGVPNTIREQLEERYSIPLYSHLLY